MAWIAGMLYLPRLFVYHADAETGLGPFRKRAQNHGTPAPARHHQSGDDRDVMVFGIWMLTLNPGLSA